MSLDSARTRFERRQRDLFRDVAVIERPSETSTLNTTTGALVPDPPTELYDGACLVRSFTWEGTDSQVGGEEVRLVRARCKFPVNTTVAVDDIVRPTSSTYDASMVGKSYRVTDVFVDSWQICRVVIGEEVVT